MPWSGSVAWPLKLMVCPTTQVSLASGVSITGAGGLPTVMVRMLLNPVRDS